MIINNQKEETNLKTSVTYKGNGTQKQFDFPFDYLRKAFVKVSVNNAIVDGYTIDNRSVVFNIAPASNDVIVIYRETPSDRLVSWADASVLKAADMTISQVQQLHIIEESKEWSTVNSIVLSASNEWEGRKHKIVNVLDPTAPQDVVTKHYMETVQDGFVKQNTELKNEATKQVQIATQRATKATTEADRAKTEADRAKAEADRAKAASDSVGNPVVDITQSAGSLTATKGDGSYKKFIVTPAIASQEEAEAGTDDAKMMTPLRTKQSILENAPKGVKNLGISGKEITVTFDDDTSKTLTTQDTNTTYQAGTGLTLSGTAFSLAENMRNTAYKIPYGTSSTATGVGAKVVTITNGVPFFLQAGTITLIFFTKRGTGQLDTLNINSTGAKGVYWGKHKDSCEIPSYPLLFIYNGSSYFSINNIETHYSDYSGDT